LFPDCKNPTWLQGSWGAFVCLCEGWDYFNGFGHAAIHWNGFRGRLHLGKLGDRSAAYNWQCSSRDGKGAALVCDLTIGWHIIHGPWCTQLEMWAGGWWTGYTYDCTAYALTHSSCQTKDIKLTHSSCQTKDIKLFSLETSFCLTTYSYTEVKQRPHISVVFWNQGGNTKHNYPK
jgi:hypothetical protein